MAHTVFKFLRSTPPSLPHIHTHTHTPPLYSRPVRSEVACLQLEKHPTCGRLDQNSNKLFSLRGEKISIIEELGASERRGILPNGPHVRGQAVAGQMVRVSQTTKEERVSGSKIDDVPHRHRQETVFMGTVFIVEREGKIGMSASWNFT